MDGLPAEQGFAGWYGEEGGHQLSSKLLLLHMVNGQRSLVNSQWSWWSCKSCSELRLREENKTVPAPAPDKENKKKIIQIIFLNFFQV